MTFTLVRCDDRSSEVAQLIEPMTLAQITATETAWLPFLLSAWQARLQAGVSPDDLPDHKHWRWSRKAHIYINRTGYRFFGLVAGGEMQGMMLVNSISRCRLASQQNEPLIFADYIATAPWNLRSLTDTPRCSGVGRAFIQAAIDFSRQSGMHGRIGLHSLPQAETFYRDTCGMTDCGADANEYDLHYFEMTETQADRFAQPAGGGLGA